MAMRAAAIDEQGRERMSKANPEVARAVLVGCGGISRTWLRSLVARADVEIAGMVDLAPPAVRARQAEFDLQHVPAGTDLRAMIQDVGAQVVFDCTVPSAHPTVTLTALELGCHVLGEKPLAPTLAEARRMIEAAAVHGKTYAVIQNRRYRDSIIQYRDMVQSAAVGPLTTMTANFFLGPHFGGFRDAMEHVLLIDMAIHTFDQARFIAGQDPVSVYCHEWNPVGSWYAHGAAAMCIFEMTDGLLFSYNGSWCAEGLNNSWNCDWRCVGAKGSALWDGEDGIRGETVVGAEGFFRETAPIPVPAAPGLTHRLHAGVIDDFLTSIRAGREPQTVCTDNVKSLAMMLGAVESAETGKRVDIVI